MKSHQQSEPRASVVIQRNTKLVIRHDPHTVSLISHSHNLFSNIHLNVILQFASACNWTCLKAFCTQIQCVFPNSLFGLHVQRILSVMSHWRFWNKSLCLCHRGNTRSSQNVISPIFLLCYLKAGHVKISQIFTTTLLKAWFIFTVVSIFLDSLLPLWRRACIAAR
jgi:hypothetical protein